MRMSDVRALSIPIVRPSIRRLSDFQNRFAGPTLYKSSRSRSWRRDLPCLSVTWRGVGGGGGLISRLLSGLSAAAGRVGDGGQSFEPARQTLGVLLGRGQPVFIYRYGSLGHLILDQCPSRVRSVEGDLRDVRYRPDVCRRRRNFRSRWTIHG